MQPEEGNLYQNRSIPSALDTLQVLVVIAGVGAPAMARAEVHVSPLIGDHMVLQRGQPIRLAGTAEPGETVSVSLMRGPPTVGKTKPSGSYTTKADATKHWVVVLPAQRAGGPYALTIEASNRLLFSDIWLGDVWLASGQSNMEMMLHASAGGELATATGCEGMRLFVVRHAQALNPKPDVQGSWSACTPATAAAFSAVAFHFGRELQRTLGVPIGIIQSAWAGTPAEAWTSRTALLSQPTLARLVNEFDAVVNNPARQQALQQRLREWEAKSFVQDEGNRGEGQGFARQPITPAAGWATMSIPQVWEKTGLLIDGAVWFRRDVLVPPSWAGKDLTVALGALDDYDVTYWNGERVGAIGSETPEFWSVQRKYTIPARRVRSGRNTIAVRIFDRGGDGGFAGAPEHLFVSPVVNPAETISLAGPWNYKVERRVAQVAVDWHSKPRLIGVDDPGSPTVLYNAMIAPLTATPIAGVIWYQGESNIERAAEYRTLFPSMIRTWRKAWGTPTLPFLFVQLPNFTGSPEDQKLPLGSSPWAELREAQTVALMQPKVGMAVTLDIGESSNIHPRNKQEVGRRLALAALRTAYARDAIASGPTFVAAAAEGSAMRVRFNVSNGGLGTTDGAPPQGFIIAGGNRVWHRGNAQIENDTVVVSSPDVPAPVAVRYGWANDPVATLMNLAALPAAPFRSDSW